MDAILLFIIIAISLCELMGQSCLKYFNVNGRTKTHFYMMGVLFYAVVCFLLVQTYRFKDMGIINVIWSGISTLVVLVGGYLIFGEEVTFMDKVGVVFILAGVFFILYEGTHPVSAK